MLGDEGKWNYEIGQESETYSTFIKESNTNVFLLYNYTSSSLYFVDATQNNAFSGEFVIYLIQLRRINFL